MNVTINPTWAGQSQVDWQNPTNAFSGDSNAYAQNIVGSSGTGYLILGFPSASIPADATVTGVKIAINCSVQVGGNSTAVIYGYVRTLTLQLAKDGITYSGSIKRTSDLPSVALAVQNIGGDGDLWGLSFTPTELNAGTLKLRIQRSQGFGDEDTSAYRTVESAVLTVYFTQTQSAGGGTRTMPRTEETQLVLIGKENPRGTQVPTTQRLKSWRFQPQPQDEYKTINFMGDLVDGEDFLIHQASEATVDGYPTYDEIGWLLQSGIAKPSTSTLAAGVYRHEFWLDTKAAANVQTYTGEYGDLNNAERILHMILSELTLTTTKKDGGVGGKFIARGITDATISTPPNNEVQTLTLNSATAVTLRFKGQTTASIATPAAANVQSALQGLSNIGAGNVSVSGAGSLVITFASALAGQPQPLIEVVASTGGVPTIARTTPGGFNESTVIPILPSTWGLYYGNTYATLGQAGNKLTKLVGASLAMNNRFTAYDYMDPSVGDTFAGALEDQIGLTMNATVEADTVAAGIFTDLKNRAPKYVRLESVGPQIGATGFNYTMTVDMACKTKLRGNFRAEGKIVAREFAFKARYDQTTGFAFKVVLINDVASY